MAQTKKPQVTKGTGPNQLPQGAATALNQQLPPSRETPPPYQDSLEQSLPGQEVKPEVTGDITGMDKVLFGGTDRPTEPITAGMPFGPGPSFVKMGAETDQAFMQRVGGQIASSPNANSRTRSFLARVMRGA